MEHSVDECGILHPTTISSACDLLNWGIVFDSQLGEASMKQKSFSSTLRRKRTWAFALQLLTPWLFMLGSLEWNVTSISYLNALEDVTTRRNGLNDWKIIYCQWWVEMWWGQGQSRSKVDSRSKWVNGEGKMVNLPPLQRKDWSTLGCKPQRYKYPQNCLLGDSWLEWYDMGLGTHHKGQFSLYIISLLNTDLTIGGAFLRKNTRGRPSCRSLGEDTSPSQDQQYVSQT